MIEKIPALLKLIPKDAECIYCVITNLNSREFIVLSEETECSDYEDTYLQMTYPYTNKSLKQISIENISTFENHTVALSLLLRWKENKTFPREIKYFYYYRTKTDLDLFVYESLL